jgi:serine protease Do
MAQSGQTVKLTVWRAGREFEVRPTIIEWPKPLWDRLNAPIETAPVETAIPPNLGLSLAEVTDDLRAKYGLEPGQTGVLVAGVMSNTDAADRGLATGDVILRVQDRPVATPQSVQAVIDAVREQKRAFAVMLVLPKAQQSPFPGPKWMALRVASG